MHINFIITIITYNQQIETFGKFATPQQLCQN